MLRTLRSKLILSYTAIAVLSLMLALGVVSLLARDVAQEAGFKSLSEKRSLASPYIELLVGLEIQEAKRDAKLPLSRPILNGIGDNIRGSGLRVLLVNPLTLKIEEDTSLNYNAVGERMLFSDTIDKFEGRIARGSVQAIGMLPGGDKQEYQYYANRPLITKKRASGDLSLEIAELLSPGSQVVITPISGRGSTGGGSASPILPQLQPRVLSPFIVVVAQRQTQLIELFNQVAPYLLPAVVLALMVSFFAAYVLGRQIARPVSRLAAATEAIASGDYSRRIPVEGDGEFAALSGGFNKMAEEVDRAHRMQRDFVANVSHELKTPLTSIQGFSQAMLDGAVKSGEDYRQAALIINQESQRMNRLVGEILGLAKLQNGLHTLEMKPVELAPVLSQLILAMQPQAAGAGVNLAARYEHSGDIVLADTDRLKQVFGNLIENAVKHTPVGGTVIVTLGRVGDNASVLVQDTGRGIPTEELRRVTERFYQVDKSRAAGESRSLGLGLAIAREILAAHHGELLIESEPGVGTLVSVLLPAQSAPSEGGNVARAKARGTAPLVWNRSKSRDNDEVG